MLVDEIMCDVVLRIEEIHPVDASSSGSAPERNQEAGQQSSPATPCVRRGTDSPA